MTKPEVLDAIAIAKANGNVRLAALLANVYRDVLAQPDPPKSRIEPSPINSVGKVSWEDVRLEL